MARHFGVARAAGATVVCDDGVNLTTVDGPSKPSSVGATSTTRSDRAMTHGHEHGEQPEVIDSPPARLPWSCATPTSVRFLCSVIYDRRPPLPRPARGDRHAFPRPGKRTNATSEHPPCGRCIARGESDEVLPCASSGNTPAGGGVEQARVRSVARRAGMDGN